MPVFNYPASSIEKLSPLNCTDKSLIKIFLGGEEDGKEILWITYIGNVVFAVVCESVQAAEPELKMESLSLSHV